MDRSSDQHMPIDVALALEEVAGKPILTGAMASLQGYTLAKPEAAAPDIGRSVAALSRHAGEVGARFLEANADGHIDPTERADMLHQAERTTTALQDVVAGLSGGALRVVA